MKEMMKRKIKQVGLIVFACIIFHSHGTIAQTMRIQSQFGGQLDWYSLNEPQNLNPILATTRIEKLITDLSFNYLVSKDYDSDSPIGELVEDWQLKPMVGDQTRLKITLKRNIKWHDGNDFTAKDVIFTYRAIVCERSISPLKSKLQVIDRMREIGDYEISIVFRGYVDIDTALNALHFKIIPHHVFPNIPHDRWEEPETIEPEIKADDPFNTQPDLNIGTGPFKLVARQNTSSMLFERSDLYKVKEKPYIFKIYIHFKQHDSSMSGPLGLRDTVDLFLDITPATLNRVNKKYLRVIQKDSVSFTFIGINQNVARHLKLERYNALNYLARGISQSIDIPTIIDNQFTRAWNNTYVYQINGPAPYQGSIGVSWHNNFPVVDREDAKQKLMNFRLMIGQQEEIKLNVLYQDKSDIQKNLIRTLDRALRTLGTNIILNPEAKPVNDRDYWRIINNKLIDSSDNKVYHLVLHTAFPGNNLIRYYYEKWSSYGHENFLSYNRTDSIIADAIEETNTETRLMSEKQIFNHILENVPAVWLWSKQEINILNKRLEDVDIRGGNVFYNIQDWYFAD